MVKIITEIYGLHDLARTEKGKLFKNENIYNLIMSFLFKRTKIKNFILHSIRINFKAKAESFAQRLKLFKGKPITFFGVSHKFTLQPRLEISEGREKAGSSEIEHPLQDPVRMSLPYERSLRLMDDLTRGGSPVTKLKTIVSISKELVF